MIASQPELPGATGWPTAAGTHAALAASAEGAGLDFAGLLGAASPPPASPALTPASGGPAEGEPAPAPAPFAATTFAQMPSPLPLPTGKFMPERSASLPPAVPVVVPAELSAPDADPVAAEDVPAGVLPVEGTVPALSAPAGGPEASPAPGPDSATTPDAGAEEPGPTAALPSDPALLTAIVPAPAPALIAAPLPVRLHRAALLSPTDDAIALMPARVTLSPATGDTPPAEVAPEASAASTSAPPSTPPPALSPATDSAPQPAHSPAPAPTLAAAPTAIAGPAPDRIEAPRTPAPQQESAIAQVGDLREALRSARPEMTLRHAEFGFVSLRLEQPAPEQWRAVLASRDPGFVPAIQAALAERGVAAAAASADTGQFMGQNGTPQNGSGDHRYGASPNGGQGSLSPYMGQSGQRDGEAAPDHRRPSTAAALAARGQDGEEASGNDARGLFA